MADETWGQWRLLTPNDFQKSLSRVDLETSASARAELPPKGHVHVAPARMHHAINALGHHATNLHFEHGQEGRIPRANTLRPYRLTVGGRLAAAIALRTSEAFNVSEIDEFVTAEIEGLAPLESTRAALLFALCDAVKTGGSMAIQFRRECASQGIPVHVRQLAEQRGVALGHCDAGAISPEEARTLFLRLSGLPEEAQARIEDLAHRRFFSIERVCYLVVHGLWSVVEASCALLCSPYPEFIFGESIDPTTRLLSAHALDHAQAAILGGIFDRAVRYVSPSVQDSRVTERYQFAEIPRSYLSCRLAVQHGPFPQNVDLRGWVPYGKASYVISEGEHLVVLSRPRHREAVRVFLRHDLDEAAEVYQEAEKALVVLLYTGDYRELSEDERRQAATAARRRNVEILACPESAATLETEALRRLRVGRTVRR